MIQLYLAISFPFLQLHRMHTEYTEYTEYTENNIALAETWMKPTPYITRGQPGQDLFYSFAIFSSYVKQMFYFLFRKFYLKNIVFFLLNNLRLLKFLVWLQNIYLFDHLLQWKASVNGRLENIFQGELWRLYYY